MSLDRPDRPEEAETLFAAWAVRAEAGEAVRIEELLDAHPEHKEALTRLHEDWKLFAPLLGRAVPGKISEASGIVLAPITSHGKGAVEGPSPELIERLGINIPDSGRYRFRSVLGRGGGGVVLKVWDTKLNRALAMKVVLGRDEERPDGSTPRVDSRTLSRFVDEARIASQLNHPGIVPVHELGTDESGRAFFTMKLVKGEDLSKIFEHVKTGHDGWNQTRALNVLLRVCESLAFAHERGVIHRDLKPANIMVGRHGEVYVMDWGLARVLGEEDKRDVRLQPPPKSSALLTVRGRRPESDADSPLYTMDGDVVGTPAYMAPEQAAGRLDLMGPHSDVYAVGAMLYHLLAGHMPYVPEGARLNNYAVWQRVQEGPPESLILKASNAAPELAAICEKAMARSHLGRYETARLLSQDISAFLDGRVVRVYESGAWAEGRKWILRNRTTAAALGSSVGFGAIALIVVSLSWQSTRRDLLEADSLLGAKRAAIDAAVVRLTSINQELTASQSSLASLQMELELLDDSIAEKSSLLQRTATAGRRMQQLESNVQAATETLKCDRCCGAGQEVADCPACGGRGRVHVMAFGVGAQKACPRCKGLGRITTTCAACNGLGGVSAPSGRHNSESGFNPAIASVGGATGQPTSRLVPPGNIQQSIFDVELVRNGDCEEPSSGAGVPRWETVSGDWMPTAVAGALQDARSGQYYFRAVGRQSIEEIRQDIDISAAGGGDGSQAVHFVLKARVAGHFQRGAGDESQIVVEYIGKSSSVIGEPVKSDPKQFDSWTDIQLDGIVPPEAVILRLRLLSFRQRGTMNDGYFDNLSLKLARNQR